MANPLECTETRAVKGETLQCTYLGKANAGHYIPDGLEIGKTYAVEWVEGLMIKLRGVNGLVYPNQLRRA